uniref:P-type domain-containing protein n=1 Tax=Globodera pallida TaxID=36090 RepID=A0A183BZQ8_GLOPA
MKDVCWKATGCVESTCSYQNEQKTWSKVSKGCTINVDGACPRLKKRCLIDGGKPAADCSVCTGYKCNDKISPEVVWCWNGTVDDDKQAFTELNKGCLTLSKLWKMKLPFDEFGQTACKALNGTISRKLCDGNWCNAEPGQTEPGHTEPGHTEPGHTEPGQTEPGHTEPSQHGDVCWKATGCVESTCSYRIFSIVYKCNDKISPEVVWCWNGTVDDDKQAFTELKCEDASCFSLLCVGAENSLLFQSKGCLTLSKLWKMKLPFVEFGQTACKALNGTISRKLCDGNWCNAAPGQKDPSQNGVRNEPFAVPSLTLATIVGTDHFLDDPKTIVKQLRNAELGYLKAAEQFKQLRQMIEKRAYYDDQRVSMRGESDGADLHTHVKQVLSSIGNGCMCNGTSILIQQSIKTSFVSGSLSIHLLCASLSLSTQAPVTTDECNRFISLIYNGAMNMSLELTSEDMLCTLVNGHCETRQPMIAPISCNYCKIVHQKALKVSDAFSELFMGFSILCSRIPDEGAKKYCMKNVNLMTQQIKAILNLKLDEDGADFNCNHFFNCKN